MWPYQLGTATFDDESLGLPKTAIKNDKIAQVHQMGQDNRLIKVKVVAEAMNMYKKRYCHILNQYLGMRKMYARWEPRFLTLDQKRVRMHISNAMLAQFPCYKLEFRQ